MEAVTIDRPGGGYEVGLRRLNKSVSPGNVSRLKPTHNSTTHGDRLSQTVITLSLIG